MPKRAAELGMFLYLGIDDAEFRVTAIKISRKTYGSSILLNGCHRKISVVMNGDFQGTHKSCHNIMYVSSAFIDSTICSNNNNNTATTTPPTTTITLTSAMLR